MNKAYKQQVELLLKIIPTLSGIENFAVHGGTAINLYVLDLPRYSVDIDVTYIPVNLIMDTFGAMALASLPPSPVVMKNKPRDRNAFIINKPMGYNICGVGLFFFALTLGFLYIFQHADITGMQDLLSLKLGENNAVTPYEQTLLFSIFVWTHFWYMFNARSFGASNSYFKLKQSFGFKWIVAIILLGQIVIVELLYNFFNVEPMFHTRDWQLNLNGCIDWLIIVALSSLVLWVREGWRFVIKK